jgi:threonine dehydrogenase-like Zn-dependent dehydrogenase
MRGVILHSAGDVRVEDRDDPKIIEPTDAVIRLAATCICGSDLWPYRGIEPADHQVSAVGATVPWAQRSSWASPIRSPSGPRI